MVWSLCLGCPGEHQLDVLPGNVLGLPSVLEYQPFRFVNFHAQAHIWQQAAQNSAVHVEERCREFHMDFGFMRSLANYYTQPSKATDRVVLSYNGFSSYLMLLHGLFGSSSQHLRNPHWILLRRSCTALLSLMAGLFIPIKVASLLDHPPLVTCSSVNLAMLWNQRELTAHLRMGLLRSIMAILLSRYKRFCICPASHPSSGQQCYFTWSTFTTDLYTWLHTKLPSKATLGSNRTCLTSYFLGHRCVLNGLANAIANYTVMTLPVSS